MLIEKLIFNMIAFALFIIIFFKMIKKNDANYVIILAISAIGIAINFIEIIFNLKAGIVLKTIMYILAVIVPIIVILLEAKGYIFSEILYIGLAKACILFKNNKQAKAFLILLLNKYPQNVKGHKNLAQIYEKEGGMRRALDEYIKVIDIDSKDYDSYYKVGLLLNELDKKEDAIVILEDLLKKKPERKDATFLLGDILCEQDRTKEAIHIYTEALKYNPQSYELYYHIAMAYTMQNDFSNAMMFYKKAAEINAILYNAYYNIGQIYLISGDLEEAEKYFQKSLQGEEQEADSYYKLAKIYMINGDKENAIKFLNAAIDTDNSYADIANKEPLFIPIKSLLHFPNLEDINEKETKLTNKEIKLKKHLEDTYKLSGNLSNNEFKISIQKNKQKDIGKERE